MSTRMKRGRPFVTASPQRRAEGRPSRARSEDASSPVTRAEASVLSAALSLGQAKLLHDGTGASRNRIARRRAWLIRMLGGDRQEAKRIEAATLVTRLDLAALANVSDAGIRARLSEGITRALAVSRESGVESTAGIVSLARAMRFSSLADACLDAAVTGKLDGELLALAAKLASASRLDLLAGLEAERRAREAQDGGALDASGIDLDVAARLLARAAHERGGERFDAATGVDASGDESASSKPQEGRNDPS